MLAASAPAMSPPSGSATTLWSSDHQWWARGDLPTTQWAMTHVRDVAPALLRSLGHDGLRRIE